ncbi:hypothetical protein A5489_02175 [Enterococcus faecium]|nr:hypothetical protein A5489_02175 [Enterococcus faecium]
MIRKQPDVEEGEIAAVVISGDNEATLKRVKRQNGLTMLIPDDTDYKPYIITESNPDTILGKAVKVSFNL